MKLGKVFAAALLGLTLASTPVIADDALAQAGEPGAAAPQQGGQTMCQCPCAMMGGGGMGMGMMGGGMMGGQMMMQGHQLMQESMGMLKETITILKDLSNKPTAAQKTRLDAMARRMDEMMKQHDQMMQMKKGGGASPAPPQEQPK